MRTAKRQPGFTLIEMVMVLVLVGILSVFLAEFVRQSGKAFSDTQIRDELTSKGRLALERMSRELREAYPDSIRAVGDHLSFRQLNGLSSLTQQGAAVIKEYNACQDIGVRLQGGALRWDLADDGDFDAVLIDDVQGAGFQYQESIANQRSAVVTLDITLARADEQVRLFREVHIRNTRGQVTCN